MSVMTHATMLRATGTTERALRVPQLLLRPSHHAVRPIDHLKPLLFQNPPSLLLLLDQVIPPLDRRQRQDHQFGPPVDHQTVRQLQDLLRIQLCRQQGSQLRIHPIVLQERQAHLGRRRFQVHDRRTLHRLPDQQPPLRSIPHNSHLIVHHQVQQRLLQQPLHMHHLALRLSMQLCRF